MTHVLKLWRGYFQAVLDGSKTFELRREDDRHFAPGDTLILREYLPELEEMAEATGDEDIQYTGRQIEAQVTYVLRRNVQWLQPGVACLGIRLKSGSPIGGEERPGLPPHLRDNPKAIQAYDAYSATFQYVARLQSVRQKAGLTQDALARRMGVSRRFIARWEADDTGRIPLGRYFQWLAICEAEGDKQGDEP